MYRPSKRPTRMAHDVTNRGRMTTKASYLMAISSMKTLRLFLYTAPTKADSKIAKACKLENYFWSYIVDSYDEFVSWIKKVFIKPS